MKLINIIKKYDNNCVLDGINLELKNKGLVFVLGNSGSGKSTLLHIMGLLDTNYEGEIKLNDNAVSKSKKDRGKNIRDNIDFVFQDFNLIDSLSVEDNMKLASDIIGQETEKANVDEICKRLAIEHCKGRNTNRLSGGEKQRAAIGRALIRNNTILLADEPTGNLDNDNEKNIFELLKEISKDRLVIVVTHNVEAAEQYGDRIIKIKNGAIEEDIDKGYNKNNVVLFKEKNRIKNNKNKWIWKLALSNLKNRKKKIVPSSIMMLICILSIGGIFGIQASMRNMVSGIDNGIFENDRKCVECYDLYRGNEVISEEFLNQVNQMDNVNCVNSSFKCYLNAMNGNEVFSYDVTYHVIEDNNFYRERYKLIEGDFPKNKNEIIINESFAERYFGSKKVIGNTLWLNNLEAENLECIVVGVKEDGIAKKDEIYALPSFSEWLYELLIINRSATLEFSNEESEFEDGTFYLGVSWEDVKNKAEYKLVYGKEPTNENDMVVDVNAVNIILYCLGRERNYSNQQLIDGELSKEDLETILEAEIKYCASTLKIDITPINITGICASNSSLYHEYSNEETGGRAYLSNTFFNSMLEKEFITDVTVYVNDYEAEEELGNLCKEYGYQMANANEETIRNVGYQLSTITMLMSIVTVIIFFISIFMINFATKINVIDCTYEIGVLKSMGASNKFVFLRFLSENLIQGLFVGMVAVIIGVMLDKFEVVKYQEINLLDFEWYYWLGIVIISVLISLVSGIGENIKIARSDILKSIKNI